MLPKGREVLQVAHVELTNGTCREPALQHQLELDQLLSLLIVAHRSSHAVPALRNEGPASASPASLQQPVLAHRLQRPAYRDLTDAQGLRNHPGVGEPVSGRQVPQANL